MRSENKAEPDVWQIVLEKLSLQGQKSPHFGQVTGVEITGDRATLSVTTQTAIEVLQHRNGLIERTLSDVVGRPVVVDFVVVESELPEVEEVDWYELDRHQDQQPRKTEHKLNGFTPVLDVVADELGLTQAVVFGLVWRHCQMRDGVCKASVATLAKLAGIKSVKTVRGHLKALCDAGYIKDLTPNLKHRPHVYKDAGKVTIETETKVTINR